MDIQGTCDERFGAMREAFAANFAEGSEPTDVGASLAMTLDGELVVDLWGGTVTTDSAADVPWERDTIINVWSTTKTLSALCCLLLADQGELDLYAPVAKVWPEFGAGGKREIAMRHVMSHTAGLSGWQEPITVEDLYDWEKVTSLLAAQEPWWEPGTASGYHAIDPGVPGGGGRAAGDGADDRRVRRQGGDWSARRRLPHRHCGRARRPGRSRDPAERTALGRGRRGGLDRAAHAAQSAAAARCGGVEHDPVAAGRDPGRRWARQCPGGRAGPHPDGVRRRGQRRPAALAARASSRCSTSRRTARTS